MGDKTLALLEWIRRFIEERHYPPTFAEMRAGTGLSSNNTIEYHLHLLERSGLIERTRRVARGIRLLKEDGHGDEHGSSKDSHNQVDGCRSAGSD
jgi:repressor LexA